MPRVTFFPTGNAGCALINGLPSKRTIVFDYADQYSGRAGDTRIDLASALADALNQDYVDVLAFSHIDLDHVQGAHEFFHFDHADKYNGGVEILELWVPAAAIVEVGTDDDSRIIRSEARHRLKEGKGIRVFSRPEVLKTWLEENDLTIDQRRHLFVDAGTLVPSFSPINDGLEIFAHSPFASRIDGGAAIDRNTDAIMLQATFTVNNVDTKLLLTGDAGYQMLSDVVDVTRLHKRDDRLEWDIMQIAHHCSYLSLSEEKGTQKTKPVENVRWLFEDRCRTSPILVSPSNLIPLEDTKMPPHLQAANYYRDVAKAKGGEFIVTMDHPSRTQPKPLVIEIDSTRARVTGIAVTAAIGTASQSSPRAGGL